MVAREQMSLSLTTCLLYCAAAGFLAPAMQRGGENAPEISAAQWGLGEASTRICHPEQNQYRSQKQSAPAEQHPGDVHFSPFS